MIGQYLYPLYLFVAAQPFAQRADVGLGVAVTRHQYVAQPERLAVFFEPCRRAERLGIVAPRERAVALRIGLLDVEQHQVDQPQQLLDRRVPDAAVRVEADVDARPVQLPHERHQRRGLERRLAAREGHPAAPSEERFLVCGHAQDLFRRRGLSPAGVDRIGVGTVEAAEIAALQENDEPESRPVESSHRFVGMYSKHNLNIVALLAVGRRNLRPAGRNL